MDVRLAERIESLARWYTSASEEARYKAWEKAIHGDPQAPSLFELRAATILSETEAGKVSEG